MVANRLSGSNTRRRRPRRQIAGAPNTGRNPEHYDGLEDDGPPVVGQDETPNDQVSQLLNDSGSDDSAPTPEGRLDDVTGKSPEYAPEYRLQLLHRLLMRRIPLDEIAKQLGVSVRTVQRDRDKLNAQMRKEAGSMDMNEYVGDTVAFFNEIRSLALRIGTSSNNPLSSRLAALSRAMQAQKDKTAVLQVAGVFDAIKFKADEDGASDELGELIDLVEKALNNEEMDEIIADMSLEDEEMKELVRIL